MKKNVTLWVVQGMLAALFLFAGGSKLVMPLEAMQQGPVVFPGAFLRFIGVAEVLGALGLVLPCALRIRPLLTPIAAAGLLIIMAGATTITASSMGASAALFPAIVGILAAAVGYGRVAERATA